MSQQPQNPFPSPTDTITESTAVDYTTNYRDYISKIDPSPDYIRAFLIPMSDMINLSDFQYQNCPNVRAYLGMAKPGDITTLKLVIVPVDAKGNDVLSITPPGDGAADQSAIYDFTSPCPQACDVDSPLFQ